MTPAMNIALPQNRIKQIINGFGPEFLGIFMHSCAFVHDELLSGKMAARRYSRLRA